MSAALRLRVDAVQDPARAQDAHLEALVLRVCDQHEPSFAQLYEATCARVNGLVLRIVRVSAVAEEVVEEVYWQAWREAPRFDATRGSVMAWLLAIGRSRALDALRRLERVRAVEVVVDHPELLAFDAFSPLRDETVSGAAAGSAWADPSDLLGVARHHARLHAVLDGLDALPRQLLALAFFRDCTHEDIAQQTGLPLGTVKSHIRRTLVLLRRQFDGVAASEHDRLP